ncbi:MAG: hypothetical protein L6R41_006300 [Letrouitia leprolyta]|nr:MAG: hypothetical protein L6R41_006300 [Letrouitia leprolyta]
MLALRNYTPTWRRSAAALSPHARILQQRNFFTFVRPYEKGVLFKSGRYIGEKSSGFRLSIPVFHRTVRVDMRTQSMQIPSQELMTRDNVTIHVDAVAFFQITKAQKSLCAVIDYEASVSEVAQTSLRGQLSNSTFDEVLHDREEAGKNILAALNEITSAWGVTVDAVKLKNIRIDPSMVRAMGRRAEAERIREARLIEASAEFESSKKLVEAAREFEKAPLGLRLRELQTYTQIAAEKNTVLVPGNLQSGIVESLLALKGKEGLKRGNTEIDGKRTEDKDCKSEKGRQKSNFDKTSL